MCHVLLMTSLGPFKSIHCENGSHPLLEVKHFNPIKSIESVTYFPLQSSSIVNITEDFEMVLSNYSNEISLAVSL